MAHPTSTILYANRPVTLTWIKTTKLSAFTSITQAYAICFNAQRHALIVRKPGMSWNLPGGTPLPGESPTDALIREVLEEADAQITAIRPLGVQQVQDATSTIYQARFTCQLDRLLPQTPEPDTGLIWDRLLVPFSRLNSDYLHWHNSVAESLFQDAASVI
jgi:8-oxo-dGTP pyrophosphatase MutT (NUDIX family)